MSSNQDASESEPPRKNAVLAGFALLALVLGYGGLYLTDLPAAVFVVIVAVGGIAASLLVRKYLDVG